MEEILVMLMGISVGLVWAASCPEAGESKENRRICPGPDPGPQVLEGCKRIEADPPAYMTTYYIVQAPPERISKAVGWVKHVEENVYPTEVEVLGYRPTHELYAVIFKYDYPKPKTPLVYQGFCVFDKTAYKVHKISARCDKLDLMPPWQTTGGILHETIHALLREPKCQANWKPIREPEMLDLVFQMEVDRRLTLKKELDDVWQQYFAKEPKSHRGVLGQFWREYGWQPFQKLLVKLHDNLTYKPTMDEATFAYEMSLGTGKDTSGFFEQRGWKIPGATKARIQRELKAGGKGRQDVTPTCGR